MGREIDISVRRLMKRMIALTCIDLLHAVNVTVVCLRGLCRG